MEEIASHPVDGCDDVRPIARNRLASRTVPFRTFRLKVRDASSKVVQYKLGAGHSVWGAHSSSAKALSFEDWQ